MLLPPSPAISVNEKDVNNLYPSHFPEASRVLLSTVPGFAAESAASCQGSQSFQAGAPGLLGRALEDLPPQVVLGRSSSLLRNTSVVLCLVAALLSQPSHFRSLSKHLRGSYQAQFLEDDYEMWYQLPNTSQSLLAGLPPWKVGFQNTMPVCSSQSAVFLWLRGSSRPRTLCLLYLQWLSSLAVVPVPAASEGLCSPSGWALNEQPPFKFPVKLSLCCSLSQEKKTPLFLPLGNSYIPQEALQGP